MFTLVVIIILLTLCIYHLATEVFIGKLLAMGMSVDTSMGSLMMKGVMDK